MDFNLDETHQAVADLAATVLGGGRDASVDDEAAWKALGQAGLLAVALPASVGGDDLGCLAVGVVLAEVGRHALAVPTLATLALGVLPISRTATGRLQRELLDEVGNGRVLSAAVREIEGSTVGVHGATVTGQRVGVPFAEHAHRLLVPVGDRTLVVDPHQDAITITRTTTSSGSPEYSVRFDSSEYEDEIDASVDDLDRCAVAGAAAQAAGLVSGALALTAEHLRTRVQFGRPLATFQAVAQQVADVYITARTMQLVAQSAAWRLDAGLDADEDLATAAYWIANEVPEALRRCHHLHGGLGVDVSYPLHRYYSHAKDLARFVGGADHRLDRLGA